MRSIGKSLRQAALALNALGEGSEITLTTSSKTTARNFWGCVEHLNSQGAYPQRLKYDTRNEAILNEETLGQVKFHILEREWINESAPISDKAMRKLKTMNRKQDNSKAYSIIAVIVIAVFIGGLINAG